MKSPVAVNSSRGNSPLISRSPSASARSAKDDAAQPSVSEISTGLILFAISMALFALYACIIKYIMKEWLLSTPELTYYVSLMMLGLLLIGVKYAEQDVFSIAKGAQFDLVCRAGSGFLSDVLLFVAFHYTSYSKAFCLFFTCPLMCPFLARCLLGEKIKLWDVIAVVLGFIGTLMLVQPFKETDEDAESDIVGCIIGLCSAFFAALAIVYLRKLAERIHFTLVPMYNMLAAVLLAPIWSTF